MSNLTFEQQEDGPCVMSETSRSHEELFRTAKLGDVDYFKYLFDKEKFSQEDISKALGIASANDQNEIFKFLQGHVS